MSAIPETPVDVRRRPPAGTWNIDPGHATVAFVGRHMMLARVRGRFTGVEGAIVVDDSLEASRVEVTIDMASVASGSMARDEHLRSSDLFDVARHPTARFVAAGVEVDGTTGTLTGDLTIRGVTRPVTLEVTYVGHGADPWGGERIVFSARGRVDREDFGVTWNLPLDGGGVLVSRSIDIEIDLEAVRDDTT